MMPWHHTNRADARVAALADRHYSRQSHGSRQFTPPGRVLVLRTLDATAAWATNWPYTEYVHRKIHPAAWVCTFFRREPECLHRASDLVRAAVAATRWYWGDSPEDGMVTMVDARQVAHKRDPGRCFRRAGFRPVGVTDGGLLVLRLAPEDMPSPLMPNDVQLPLFAESEVVS